MAVFCATVWFYTKAYITDTIFPDAHERNKWYYHHQRFVKFSQAVLFLILTAIAVYFGVMYYSRIPSLSLLQWILIIFFPVVGALYYGITNSFNLRNIGWLKPFLIGITWAGLVNVYPILFHDITHNIQTEIHFVNIVLFIKNFMFVTVLCIMFDIKDYIDDYNKQLKTFVVKNGLRKTIFYIILPLSAAGLSVFWIYSYTQHYSVMKVLLNTLPFIALIIVAYSLQRRKSILYYLILIDGLMLLKAICGSVAMLYF